MLHSSQSNDAHGVSDLRVPRERALTLRVAGLPQAGDCKSEGFEARCSRRLTPCVGRAYAPPPVCRAARRSCWSSAASVSRSATETLATRQTRLRGGTASCMGAVSGTMSVHAPVRCWLEHDLDFGPRASPQRMPLACVWLRARDRGTLFPEGSAFAGTVDGNTNPEHSTTGAESDGTYARCGSACSGCVPSGQRAGDRAASVVLEHGRDGRRLPHATAVWRDAGA